MSGLRTLLAATAILGGRIPQLPIGGERHNHKPFYLSKSDEWVCSEGQCKLRTATLAEFLLEDSSISREERAKWEAVREKALRQKSDDDLRLLIVGNHRAPKGRSRRERQREASK